MSGIKFSRFSDQILIILKIVSQTFCFAGIKMTSINVLITVMTALNALRLQFI
jgi:hypothetical protein